MANYKVVGNVTGLAIGDRVTEEQLKKDHPGLNWEKLVRNGAVVPSTGKEDEDESKKLREENYNTGSPLPLSKDQDMDEAIKQNLGQGAPDTAERQHPRKGGPGAVRRTEAADSDEGGKKNAR
jgi:hypothetical protein